MTDGSARGEVGRNETPSTAADLGAASVDPREVEHYTRLAATWWDPDGPFWPLHVLNRLRVEWIVAQVTAVRGRDAQAPDALAGLTALEIGCGGGILAEALARRGARVTAIDVTAKNIAVAERHREQVHTDEGLELPITYRHQALEALPAGAYDIVCNMEVLEHVNGPVAFLERSAAQVRPGGQLFVATINRTLRAFLIAIVGAEYVLRILPRGTHRWGKFLRPAELTAPLETAGFTIAARTGVRVNPFARRMSLVRDESINFMFCAHRPGDGSGR